MYCINVQNCDFFNVFAIVADDGRVFQTLATASGHRELAVANGDELMVLRENRWMLIVGVDGC